MCAGRTGKGVVYGMTRYVRMRRRTDEVPPPSGRSRSPSDLRSLTMTCFDGQIPWSEAQS